VARSLPILDAVPAPGGTAAPLAKGFRPFFLLAGLFAVLVVPLWLVAVAGRLRLDGYLDPMIWHAHEMIFGYGGAVIAGFLLTAVGNWTGRETLVGWPLAGLAAVWLLGRVVMAAAARLPVSVVAAVDLSFLALLAVAIARPLVATRNRRNYPVLGLVVALWATNLAIHLDVLGVAPGWRWRGSFAAVDLVTLLVLFFAARVVPMFTRNATGVATIRNWPALDWATAAAMATLTVVDVARPGHGAIRWLAGATAALAVVRAIPWGTRHTWRHPLLWVLHLGQAWIVLGLTLRALPATTAIASTSSWVHALTVGGIGVTTLGMMARVALGHSGRRLAVSPMVAVGFGLVNAAAAARVLAPWWPTIYQHTLHVSGALWTLAFASFVAGYARFLTTPRADGRPG